MVVMMAFLIPILRSKISTTGVIELELTNGHRLRISGGYDPGAIGRLVQHLT